MTMLNDERIAEIEARLASYGFKDNLGHPLTNCQDFQDLLAKALKAEKAQAEAERDVLASTWQPIETAPKDGTEILGLTATHGRYIICLDENYLRLQNGEAVRWDFTHWMPLPATPEQAEKEGVKLKRPPNLYQNT